MRKTRKIIKKTVASIMITLMVISLMPVHAVAVLPWIFEPELHFPTACRNCGRLETPSNPHINCCSDCGGLDGKHKTVAEGLGIVGLLRRKPCPAAGGAVDENAVVIGLLDPLVPQYGSNGRFLAPIDRPVTGSMPISTRAQLEAISNNLSGNYHLTADIDLSGRSWVPIGNQGVNREFTGIFDGQGFVIRNMTITGSGYEHTGLFGVAAYGAEIKNVGMEGTRIDVSVAEGGSYRVGSILGSIVYTTHSIQPRIINSYSTGSVTVRVNNGGWLDVGGIAGHGTAVNCYNTGSISVSSRSQGLGTYIVAGGISAQSALTPYGTPIFDNDSVFSANCFNTGNIVVSHTPNNSINYRSTALVGGIDGRGNVFNSYNTGSISATGFDFSSSIGGIVGDGAASGGGPANVAGGRARNCYNTGSLTAQASGSASADGIAHSSASYSYNTGQVKAESVSNAASAVGVTGNYSINTGSVSAISTGNHQANSAFAYGIQGGANVYNIGNVFASSNNGTSEASGIRGYGNVYNMGSVTAVSARNSARATGIYMNRVSVYELVPIGRGYNTGEITATGPNSERISIAGDGVGSCYTLNNYGSRIGTQLSAAQMRNRSSFTGWDFNTVWDISPSVNNGFPFLRDVPVITESSSTNDDKTIADTWARDELQKAYDANLLLEDMYGYWTLPTSRLLAAEAIAKLIEVSTGKTVEQIALERNYDLTNHFSDTDSKYVTFLREAGVTTGVSSTRYDPNGIYNRAQMVTMLWRTAINVLNLDLSGYQLGTDVFRDSIPNWSGTNEAIGWAAQIGVTTGVSSTRFDSFGTLQNQQTGVFSFRAFDKVFGNISG